MADAVVPGADGAGHRPVLRREVVELLAGSLDGVVVDATVGAGGHAEALLAAAPGFTLLGFDRDPAALDLARARLAPFGDRVRLRRANFRELGAALAAEGTGPVSAIVMDLGVSSMQLDDPARGFSFRAPGPLDMRMGPDAPRTAADLLRMLDSGELARVIRTYGEDRHAGAIARRIAAALETGEMKTTADLARVVAGGMGAHERIHPATRTFQALRIAVNEELESLAEGLPQALAALRPGGRLAVISFHSLEDRIVKRAFAEAAKECVCPPGMPVCRCGHVRTMDLLTRHPVIAADDEVAENPRARSAKLRAVRRVGGAA